MLENLKKLRAESKTSQAVLAEAIGVTQQSINKYENHNVEPDIESLRRMADYFGTTIDYIVGHSELRYKVEDIQNYALNDDEAEFIAAYRQLTPSQREAVVGVMRAFLAPRCKKFTQASQIKYFIHHALTPRKYLTAILCSYRVTGKRCKGANNNEESHLCSRSRRRRSAGRAGCQEARVRPPRRIRLAFPSPLW